MAIFINIENMIIKNKTNKKAPFRRAK